MQNSPSPSNLATPNYLGSRDLSESLADKIVEYYRTNPIYPKSFVDKIRVNVYRNPNTGDFCLRSNLNELFVNIVDLEERHGLA